MNNPISRLRRFLAEPMADTISDVEIAPTLPSPAPLPWVVPFWTGDPDWAPGAEPLLPIDRKIAEEAHALGIRQSAGGYFYRPAGTPGADVRPLCHGWEDLGEMLPTLRAELTK